MLWAVATAIFFGIRMIPGDPAEAIMGGPGSQASAEALAAARAEYGLDQPLFVQYFGQLWRLATGDLGTSYSLKIPVAEVLGELVPPTLTLAVLALLVAWVLALAVATRVHPQRRRGSRAGLRAGNRLRRGAALLAGQRADPALFHLAGLAAAGEHANPRRAGAARGHPGPAAGRVPGPGHARHHARGPHLLLCPLRAGARRIENGVLLRHSLRHAALPGIALSGWAFGSLLSGAVVVESIFARPGLGRSLLSAVTARDIPMVTGVALLSAAAYVVIMAFSDLAERLADPRMRAA